MLIEYYSSISRKILIVFLGFLGLGEKSYGSALPIYDLQSPLIAVSLLQKSPQLRFEWVFGNTGTRCRPSEVTLKKTGRRSRTFRLKPENQRIISRDEEVDDLIAGKFPVSEEALGLSYTVDVPAGYPVGSFELVAFRFENCGLAEKTYKLIRKSHLVPVLNQKLQGDPSNVNKVPVVFVGSTLGQTEVLELRREFNEIWNVCKIELDIQNSYRWERLGKVQSFLFHWELDSAILGSLEKVISQVEETPLFLVVANTEGLGLGINGFSLDLFQIQTPHLQNLIVRLRNKIRGFIALSSTRHSTTLAHEVGHLLLGQGHDGESDRLMSDGSLGVGISEEQCERARNFLKQNHPGGSAGRAP